MDSRQQQGLAIKRSADRKERRQVAAAIACRRCCSPPGSSRPSRRWAGRSRTIAAGGMGQQGKGWAGKQRAPTWPCPNTQPTHALDDPLQDVLVQHHRGGQTDGQGDVDGELEGLQGAAQQGGRAGWGRALNPASEMLGTCCRACGSSVRRPGPPQPALASSWKPPMAACGLELLQLGWVEMLKC